MTSMDKDTIINFESMEGEQKEEYDESDYAALIQLVVESHGYTMPLEEDKGEIKPLFACS